MRQNAVTLYSLLGLQSFQCGKGVGPSHAHTTSHSGIGHGPATCSIHRKSSAYARRQTSSTARTADSDSGNPDLTSQSPHVEECSNRSSTTPQKRKRSSKADELPSLQDAPGLPERLGDHPLRLIIVGHNPSDHAWWAATCAKNLPISICTLSYTYAFMCPHNNLGFSTSLPAARACCMKTPKPQFAHCLGNSNGVMQYLHHNSCHIYWPCHICKHCRRSGHYYSNPSNWMWRILVATHIAPAHITGPQVRSTALPQDISGECNNQSLHSVCINNSICRVLADAKHLLGVSSLAYSCGQHIAPTRTQLLMTLPHATGPPAGARTLTPALCWMQHDGCMPADAGVGFTDVGSGIPGTHSSQFDSATFQSWGSGFYARLAAHVARACDSIGCASCHAVLCLVDVSPRTPSKSFLYNVL